MSGEIAVLVIVAILGILALAFNKACDNIPDKNISNKKI